MPNAKLAYEVLDAIDAYPAHFNMNHWVCSNKPGHVDLAQLTSPACGTTACFAGWAVALSGYPIDPAREVAILPTEDGGGERIHTISDLARDLLGIGYSDGEDLFYGEDENIESEVARIFGPRPAAVDG